MTILIVGGAAQGKLAFAHSLALDMEIVDNLHVMILDAMQAGMPLPKAEDFIDKIVICNEIGSGIVPIDAFERDWRENVGRLCCDIAAQADYVYRVCCGIPRCIKGKL